MSCALAGAVLMDLALENRIDSDLESIVLIDSSPTGDELLDPVLNEIVSDTHSHGPRFWVERIARRAHAISDTAFDRLVEQGILNFDSGGFWTLSKKSPVPASILWWTVPPEAKSRAESRACCSPRSFQIPATSRSWVFSVAVAGCAPCSMRRNSNWPKSASNSSARWIS